MTNQFYAIAPKALATVQPTAQNSFLFTVLGSRTSIIICYLVLINLVTFLIFGLDKGLAKWKVKHTSTRRIPEKTLFILSVLGGSIGALLGMRVWHHKTLHKSFRIGIPLILLLQIVIPAGLYIYVHFVR